MNKKEFDIISVAKNISNYLYRDNFEATEQLMELFDKITKNPLLNWESYVKMYDDNFYTYCTWKDLIRSEFDCSDGLTEEECREQIGLTIWQLPCGWYIQYV